MKILHTMLRVKNLEESIKFYKDILGMTINKQTDFERGKFTLVFLGFGPIETHPQVELTYNWEQKEAYNLGSGYGHIALEVDDIFAYSDNLKKQNVKFTKEPGKMTFANDMENSKVIAFIEDPDGYKIELIAKG